MSDNLINPEVVFAEQRIDEFMPTFVNECRRNADVILIQHALGASAEDVLKTFFSWVRAMNGSKEAAKDMLQRIKTGIDKTLYEEVINQAIKDDNKERKRISRAKQVETIETDTQSPPSTRTRTRLKDK